jgi:hypothetical protein
MFDYPNIENFKERAGYEIDGVWYPRVTKIVEIKAKPALYYFYGELKSFQEGEDIKKKSAAEGTLIHETIEEIMLGKSPAVDPTIKPAVDAFREFVEKKNIQVDKDFVEKRLVNFDERYAGTLDAVALIDGKFGVLDIKTSLAIYRDYNLQTSAYVAALQKDLKNLQTRWILRIDQNRKCLKCGANMREKGGRIKIKNNGYKSKACDHQWSDVKGVIELQEFPYWQEDFKAFLGAKKLWEWENESWLKKAGYLN